MQKTDVYQKITDKIINLLEGHKELNYTRNWLKLSPGHALAHNPISNNVYTGINQLLLSYEMSFCNFVQNKFMTFRQISEMGGRVIKGSKSFEIVYANAVYYDKNKKRYSEQEVKKMNPAQMAALELQKVPFHKLFYVFNVEQTEGLPEHFYKVEKLAELTEFEKDNQAEDIIQATGAKIKYYVQNRAFYRPSTDEIHLPIRSQFIGAEPFYSTCFHELSHWTGHPTRLNRDLKNQFGDKNYAFEELIAELSAAYLCGMLGFENQITNNAAYLQNWLTALKDDKKFIFKASTDAQKAASFILDQAEKRIMKEAA